MNNELQPSKKDPSHVTSPEILKWSDWAEILTGDVFVGGKMAELFRNVKIFLEVRQIGPHWDTWSTFQVVHTKWYTKWSTISKDYHVT